MGKKNKGKRQKTKPIPRPAPKPAPDAPAALGAPAVSKTRPASIHIAAPQAARPLELLSFDVFQRFSAFHRIVGMLNAGKGASILDVGGYPGALTDSLLTAFPDFKMTILDKPVCNRPDYVSGSADALPFQDGKFDIVISSDTLEHIPPERRAVAIVEMLRVSRRWIILGAPFQSPCASFVEESINTLHQKCFGKPNQWLAEHISNVLPDLEETQAILEMGGAAVGILPNGSSLSWFIMESAQILMEVLPMLSPIKPALNLGFNRFWAADDDAEPAYRHILVADKAGHPPVAPDVPAADEKAVLQKLRALNELILSMAEQMLGLLSDPAAISPIIVTRYIRQMEEIIAFQEKEERRLREAMERQEVYLSRLRKSFLYRLLNKLGLM